MDNITPDTPRRRPIRRRKTKWQIFKEAYLPTIIVAVTLILVIWFLIGGAIRRSTQQQPTEPTPSDTAAPTADPMEAYRAEAAELLLQAQAAAENYDFEQAAAIVAAFSGNRADFPQLESAYQSYLETINSMVVWDDPTKVPTLSFHVLIADAAMAYADSQYGASYQKNFITVAQCRAILEQLYENGYVLVDFSDVYDEVYDESTGKTQYAAHTLSLPQGKKPLLLVQTQVNYYTYMTSGSKDGVSDGFADRLCVDESGNFYNEMTLTDGSQVTGAYDLVPVLEEFVQAHPDFSYHGARAILAVTGYDGIFGYRIHSSSLSDEALAAEQAEATHLVTALRGAGYRIACYTYENLNYGKQTAAQIQEDLQKWTTEIVPFLGGVEPDILVYAKEGDIATTDELYSGSKFNVLYNAGFRVFMSVGSTGYSQIGDRYLRHNRLPVTGNYLRSHADWYEDLFDATVLPTD